MWDSSGHTAFRLKLHPLQLGHLFILDQLDLPVSVESKTEITDSLLTAFVCAQPWQASKKAVSNWVGRVFFFLCRWLQRKTNIIHEQARLRAYFDESLTVRDLLITDHERSLSGPMHYRMHAMLIETFGYNHGEALDVPVCDAMHLWAAEAERRGTAEFATEQLKAHFELARQRDAELVASGAIDPETGHRLRNN